MTETKRTTAVAERGTGQPGLQFDLAAEAEQEVAITAKAGSMQSLVASAVDGKQDTEAIVKRAAAMLQGMTDTMNNSFNSMIKLTDPGHWVLFKDMADNLFGHLKESGCNKIAPFLGMKELGFFDPATGQPVREAVLTKEDDGSWTASVSADYYCRFFDRELRNITAYRNSAEKFTGRSEGKAKVSDVVLKNDLKQATMSLCRSKSVRVGGGFSKVPAAILVHNGIDLDKCTKGSGYGSSQERGAEKAADPATTARMQKLRTDIVGHCGGDEKAAEEEMHELADFKNDKGEMIKASWAKLGNSDGWLNKTVAKFQEKLRKEESARG